MRTRTRIRVVAVGIAGLVAAGMVGTAAQADQIYLTEGHVDVFALGYDAPNEQLTVALLDDTGPQPVVRDPDDVTLVVHDDHGGWSPAIDLTCVATTEDELWLAPRLGTPGLLWLGWNTDGLSLGEFAGGAIEAELVAAVTPPGGDAVVWDPGTPGNPDIRFHTDSTCDPGGTGISANHHHGDWGFTAPGVYELTFQFEGDHQSDGPVNSDEVTYTFRVGLD